MFTIMKKRNGRMLWYAFYRNDDIATITAAYEDITARDIWNDYKIVKTKNNETIRED